MIVAEAPPTNHRKARRCGQCNDYDPAQLSTRIRELALWTHRLVRAAEAEWSAPRRRVSFTVGSDWEFELIDAHAQSVRLERTLRAHGLDRLAAYISSLRQKVEEYLG
jgi:hypothetical protein